ncbi:MAG: hypothetical protein LIP08_04040 [Bacteroides sp.]|nr:hypothetical protein [Bacteroides sp.]
MENYSSPGYVAADTRVMSITDWLIVLIITSIPLLNLIMLCVWAFSHNTPVTKANFAKAALILMAIVFVISLLFGGAIMGMLASMYGYGY